MSISTWRKYKIAEFVERGEANIQTGPFGTQLKASNYVNSGTPVINVRNIGFGEIREENLEYVGQNMLDCLPSHILEEADIVFARKGAVERHAFVQSKHDGWMQGSDCIRLRISSNLIEPRFLSYFFLTLDHQEWMKNHGSHGATMATLNRAIISQIQVNLPSVETQRRVVDILSNYDRLIDNNTRRIALLEESIHRLYKEWFVYLRFPGCDRVNVLDGVPEGWNRKPIEEVCELVMGQSPPSTTYNTTGQGLPFHQGVTKFGSRFVSHEAYCTQPNRIAEAGDILCSVSAPVGRLNMTLDKIIIGRGLAAIRNRQGCQSFQLYQLKAHFFQEDLIGSGSIFASVTKKQLSEQMMLIPSEPILQAFENVSKPVDQQLINFHLQNTRLCEARDLLLPRLMNGSIAV